MDAAEQIEKFREHIEKKYHAQLLDNVRKGEDYLILDFSELVKFSPELAENLLENPEEVVKAAEIAVEQFDLDRDIKNFRIRIKNLPESQKLLIRHIRAKHIGQLYVFEGVVRQKGDVRPQVTSARFECPSCGNVIPVLQMEKKFKKPNICGCGRKGHFLLLSKELIDAQGLNLEESSDDLEGGGQPKRMQCLLKEDLVKPMTEKKTNPGAKVRINGFVKEVPKILKTGGESTSFDLMIEANFIEPIEEDFSELVVTKEEKEKIIALTKNPKIYKMLVSSIAPSIYGYSKVKEALILQLIGGVKKLRNDGVRTRGDMHVLLIGDPGAGKSQLIKRVSLVAPKGRYVSGKGVSGAGLTAAVVKDEFLGGWTLEAGALVLSNKGFCIIDEMDKMTKEDRSAMHEALEQQTVSISKANIQATLRCETTVLAAANPKYGRFDPYEILFKQIDLPPALISRFDLIFPIKDLPDRDKDDLIAEHILNLHADPNIGEAEIETDLLRKFIAYIRQNSKPVLGKEAIDEIKNYYVNMRNSLGEDGHKSVPITARQLEGLVRMSEAGAKIRMDTEVRKEDAHRAIELLEFCLSQIAKDSDTGKIDIDIISSGITSSKRNKIHIIKEIINELENTFGKAIPLEEVNEKAKESNMKSSTVEEIIQELKRNGDIFEPKRGIISKI